MRLLLAVFLVACAEAYLLPHAPATSLRLRTRAVQLSSADPDDRDDSAKMEDDALAKAFAARLDAEGGATNFKIKTAVSGATDDLKQGAGALGDSIKNSASIGGDGLLKADAWQLIVGLLVATVVFSFINAGMRSPAPDRFTSDGTQLEFGQRAPPSPYQPQYGVGS